MTTERKAVGADLSTHAHFSSKAADMGRSGATYGKFQRYAGGT